MDIVKSDYFYTKCIWSIAYGNNPKQTIDYLFNFFGLDSMKMYNCLDVFLGENNYFLTDEARENLKLLVKHLKGVLTDWDFQSIDSMLIGNDFNLIDGFILTQYEKRFMYDNAPASLVDSNNKARYFEYLKSMIVNDTDVLITHSSKCDKRTFEVYKAPMFSSDVLKYIGSVNMIVSERPSILYDELFMDRVKLISSIIENSEQTENTQKIYTMFKNRLK